MRLRVVTRYTKYLGDITSSKYALLLRRSFNGRMAADVLHDLPCTIFAGVRSLISSSLTLARSIPVINEALYICGTSLLFHPINLGAEKATSLPTSNSVPLLELIPYRWNHQAAIPRNSSAINTVTDVYDEQIRISNLSLLWNYNWSIQPEMESIGKPCWNIAKPTNPTAGLQASEGAILPRSATQARSVWLLDLAQCC